MYCMCPLAAWLCVVAKDMVSKSCFYIVKCGGAVLWHHYIALKSLCVFCLILYPQAMRITASWKNMHTFQSNSRRLAVLWLSIIAATTTSRSSSAGSMMIARALVLAGTYRINSFRSTFISVDVTRPLYYDASSSSSSADDPSANNTNERASNCNYYTVQLAETDHTMEIIPKDRSKPSRKVKTPFDDEAGDDCILLRMNIKIENQIGAVFRVGAKPTRKSILSSRRRDDDDVVYPIFGCGMGTTTEMYPTNPMARRLEAYLWHFLSSFKTIRVITTRTEEVDGNQRTTLVWEDDTRQVRLGLIRIDEAAAIQTTNANSKNGPRLEM